ncbi:MAG TPA: exosortase A [Casimicrobiaceae bacterium]|nr:exosortase A [Casimicrobiaceae bacterium]
MKPLYADPSATGAARPGVVPLVLPVHVVIALLLGVTLLVYLRTTVSMVSIWYRSETFTHGFVVVPLFLYLIWRDRAVLAALPVKPCLPALLGLPVAGVIWLAGDRLAINSIAQLAMMTMVPVATWALLGTRIVRSLALPFLFLFFAVPLGEFLIPQLIEWTAQFTVLALQMSGVPVLREGNFLTLPTGTWAVVEACSGVRYLIASLMIGLLFAYLSYRSALRRAMFMLAALIVPIVANWLRAYLIVMLGHLTNNRLAAGVDHLIYGWIFFGLVIGLLFWVGSRWREDEAVPPQPASRASGMPRMVDRRIVPVAGAVVALIAMWPLLAHPIAAARVRNPSAPLTLSSVPPGWTAVPTPASAWIPDIGGAAATLHETYVKDGRRVGLYVALFPESTPTTKAINVSNQLVRPANMAWHQLSITPTPLVLDGRVGSVPVAMLRGRDETIAAARWFWVDGVLVESEEIAKLREMVSLLRGHGDAVAWVIAYTPVERPEEPIAAPLGSFVDGVRPALDTMLRNAVAEP